MHRSFHGWRRIPGRPCAGAAATAGIVDRKGEWVIVDLQNSHQPDYQSIGITSRARCDQLLVKRLAEYQK
jgi:hypothetical protein